ncbi:MAG: hypothetical protein KatS3mg105_1652 [Gemmatales bacterium]|nr:MAG: hypothetical protein KatS3mg105_1652 [Gemmatales bacterium]
MQSPHIRQPRRVTRHILSMIEWPVVVAAAIPSVFTIVFVFYWLTGETANAKSSRPTAQRRLVVASNDNRPVPVEARRTSTRRTSKEPARPASPPVAIFDRSNLQAPTPVPSAAKAEATSGDSRSVLPDVAYRPGLDKIVLRTYGTMIRFVPNDPDAKALAQQLKRLRFIVHVSGNFEDDCLT